MYSVFEKLMKERKLTFSKIAREVGISPSTLTDWRAGRYEPKVDKRQKIADYFGVSLHYLDTGEVDEEDGYYLNPETAAEAQEMFEDPDMRALFDMKRNMDPKKFKAHMDMMKQLYNLERGMDDTGC